VALHPDPAHSTGQALSVKERRSRCWCTTRAAPASAAGGGLVLIAPHDALPLSAQIERRTPGLFAVDHLERGPQAWRLQFVHRG
jgi:uncharacterized protein (DUF2249 family)